MWVNEMIIARREAMARKRVAQRFAGAARRATSAEKNTRARARNGELELR